MLFRLFIKVAHLPFHQCQVLSTRVYRGSPLASDGASPDAGCGARCGVSVVALGGTAVLESGAAWEMESCWAGEGSPGGE